MSIKSFLKHRLNPKTVLKEVYNHLCHKTLPHGADEVGNLLFSGSAYLPWPGSNGPQPLDAPAETPEEPKPPDSFEAHAALYVVSYPSRDEGRPR
jgi:hypothetical protein